MKFCKENNENRGIRYELAKILLVFVIEQVLSTGVTPE